MEADPPHFSVIIPSHNRHDSLLRCIQSLAVQEPAPGRFEVIVVDDGSTLPIELSSLPSGDAFELRVVRQDRKGPAGARNAGAEQARGKYLAFTDDDCRPHASWLHHIAQYCSRFPFSAITGKTLNQLQGNTYSAAAQLLIDYLYSYYNAAPQCARFLTSNNFALPASSFHALGGFHAEFPSAGGEDREFCDRWLSRNYSVIYAPEAIVFHLHSMSLAGFLRQQFNYGRGAFHCNRLRFCRNGTRLSIEPSAFYLRMFRYPYRSQKPLKAHVSTLLFALSQGAIFAGFVFENFAHHRRIHN